MFAPPVVAALACRSAVDPAPTVGAQAPPAPPEGVARISISGLDGLAEADRARVRSVVEECLAAHPAAVGTFDWSGATGAWLPATTTQAGRGDSVDFDACLFGGLSAVRRQGLVTVVIAEPSE